MLSFGAVSFPAKIYTSVEKCDLEFHQHHGPNCLGAIRYKRVCEKCGEAVEYADIVKGTDVNGGLVLVSTDEIKQLDTEQGGIEVLMFIDPTEINPAFLGSTYYLDADIGDRGKRVNLGPARSYALLRQALVETGKIGVVRWALRQRGNLGVLRVIDRPGGPVLAIQSLLWAAEVRDTAELLGAAQNIELSDKEVTMARAFISAYAGEFDPSEFEDEYAMRLEELVATKAAGGEFRKAEAGGGDVADGSDVSDMMAKLEASIAARNAEVDASVKRHPSGRKQPAKKAAAAVVPRGPRKVGDAPAPVKRAPRKSA
jgi:DNA end-binding protein Ku